ncbi:isopentenyl-diphosphate delta-isomerase [Alteribacillus persepolensis]|uniref:Isopentenyl-diphosphate delta-isomerase n=1 Tax=Alteribacillus persepolensis TaxID=568899 RepID=A0A1G7ZHY4_9BACI|nr:type 2 isopentenyl-diphosphate Delta-isomerase [Alteribacillus persepolensis]SDH08187.1 isopentenyl-diphosphate delta-isomerase [Alteribacillus persepolensis]
MSRAERKKDHIQHALNSVTENSNSFDDVRFVHNSLPETSVSQINLSVSIGELMLSSPIIINAMTGGGDKETERINESLAACARDSGTAMAVGSQMAAFKDPAVKRTYSIVRKVNQKGLIFANLGSELTLDQAKRAVDMVEADALQIHLNVIQELVMPEGDRDFQGALETIAHISSSLEVPVIVKEVGFGVSSEAVKALKETGAAAVDIGGKGGTNFAVIENQRREEPYSFFNEWGLSTAVSLAEAVHSASKELSVIGSGGIRDGYDLAKAIALGADACGIAGRVLAAANDGGKEKAERYIQHCLHELTIIMAALGADSIQQLQSVPLVITGRTRDWLLDRGIHVSSYSRRKKE